MVAGVLLAAPAAAQIQPDVTVNPNATGTRVLLYPGGKYGRVERSLLQPGETDPNAPIRLHMPRKHTAPRVASKPKPRTAPKAEVAAAPPPQSTASLNDLPKESAARLIMEASPPPQPAKPKPAPPKPVAVAKRTPPPQPKKPPSDDNATSFLSGDLPDSTPAPPQQHVASVGPNEIAAPTAGAPKSSILFSPGQEEPPQTAAETVRNLAPGLSTALWSGTAHIQLEAYGGAHGDKGSDARRLSLKRALIIRQLLIDDGIPSERIVVRAMGGAVSGAPDRVDIFVAA